MPLNESLREYLAGECQIAATHILGATTLVDKLYYLSAVFGASQRVLNIEFSRSMVLLEVVTQYAHAALVTRLNQQDLPPLTEAIVDELGQVLHDLGDRIRDEQDYTDLLEHIATIGYAGTGNGHYLGIIGRLR